MMMIIHFLWFWAGADPDILKRPDCKGDRRLYCAVGLTVLMTGAFAVISSSYAMYSVFNSLEVAIGLGLFWGLTIATTDRFLIMTTHKTNSFSWAQLINITVRLLAAVTIGAMVAKPLEAAIFAKEIRAEIASHNLMAEVQMRQTVAQLSESVDIARLREENKQLQAQDAKLDAEFQKIYQSTIGEAEGKSGTGKAGKGIVYAEKLQELKRQKTILTATTSQHNTQVAENNQQIKTLERDLAAKVQQVQTSRLAADSIMAQIKMLHEMAEKDSVIDWASKLISWTFISIDVMPILSKLLMKRTAYDAIKQHQSNATIQLQDTLDRNLPYKVGEEVNRRNAVQTHISQLSSQALISALETAQRSKHWAKIIPEAASRFVQRVSDELSQEIDSVHTPKSKLAKEARIAIEREIPDIAKRMVKSRILRRRVKNEIEDMSGELERALNDFNNKKDD